MYEPYLLLTCIIDLSIYNEVSHAVQDKPVQLFSFSGKSLWHGHLYCMWVGGTEAIS